MLLHLRQQLMGDNSWRCFPSEHLAIDPYPYVHVRKFVYDFSRRHFTVPPLPSPLRLPLAREVI